MVRYTWRRPRLPLFIDLQGLLGVCKEVRFPRNFDVEGGEGGLFDDLESIHRGPIGQVLLNASPGLVLSFDYHCLTATFYPIVTTSGSAMPNPAPRIARFLLPASSLIGLLGLTEGEYGLLNRLAFSATFVIPVTSNISPALPFVSFAAARNLEVVSRC